MFENHLIEDGSLTSDANGFAFALRINWYRALPLSSVGLTVRVDGESVDPGAITFAVDGDRYRLGELSEHYDRMWFVTDSAGVHVERPGGLEPGPHELVVRLSSRIPYIPTRDTDVLLQVDTCVKTLAAA
jgi:hypothetical protein